MKKTNRLPGPKFIKNEQGKIVEVYLDIKTFNVFMKRLEKFEEEKKKVKKGLKKK
ncbi:MAG: hypothetical protein WC436_03575 [Candidatus Babeliales bacterium]